MAKLAPLLDRLARHDEAAVRAGEAAAKLVIASGRRGRIEGEGDFETVSAAAYSEDEVRDLLGQTGGGSRIDRLDGKNTEWSFRHEGTNYLVDAIWDGRELRAIIKRARGDEAPRTPRPVTTNQDARAPLREEFAPRKKDPRADESQTLGAVREERTVTRAKTLDPRADEDAPPRQPAKGPAEAPKEKRRDSRARRTTPRATNRSGSKRDLPKQAPASEPGKGPATPRRASDDEKAWTQVVGGPKRDPLFALEAPDADVRELKIDPDDAFNRGKSAPDQRGARAPTAHAPDISEMTAMLAEAQAARDAQKRAATERAATERPPTDRNRPPTDRDRIPTGRDRPPTERDRPPTDRDRAQADRDRPQPDRDRYPTDRDRAQADRDRPQPDRDRYPTDRDRHATDRDRPPTGREPLPAVFGVELEDVRSESDPKRVPTAPEPGREPAARSDAKPEALRAELPIPEASRPQKERPAEQPARAAAIDVETARTPRAVPASPALSPAAIEPAAGAAPRAIGLAPRSPIDTASSLDPALEKLVEQARTGGASDLHVVAGRPAIARIGGALVPAGAPLAPEAVEAMITGSIPPHRRAAFERDGAASFACVIGTSARCRVAVSRQRTGLKASIRILPPEPKTLGELELPEALDQALRHHQGLIVISGPSGQGKTTTLAAMVDHINTNSTHHILTVEDPIEFVHPRKKAMMSQREVGTHTKSFANALRSSLREDPDVIVVGELRDVETVRTALSASETGHLVLGTINTPSAPKTIDRLIDLFPPPEQPQVRATLAAALRLIASQRLLPRRDGGGRVAAVEILPGGLALSNLIRDNRTFQIPSLMQRGRGAGVVRLDDELLDLVRRGVVDRKDALAAADDPTELQSNLEGRGAGPNAGPGADRRPAGGEMAPPGPRPPPTDEAESKGGKALWQRAADMFRRGGS